MNYRTLKDHEIIKSGDMYGIGLYPYYAWNPVGEMTIGSEAIVLKLKVKEWFRRDKAFIRRPI